MTNKANSEPNRKETRSLLSVCEPLPEDQVIKPQHGDNIYPVLSLSNITLIVTQLDHTTTASPKQNNDTKPRTPANMHLPLLATLLALAATATAEKDYMLVRRTDRDITQAINKFCGYTEDLVSPKSKYTLPTPLSSPIMKEWQS